MVDEIVWVSSWQNKAPNVVYPKAIAVTPDGWSYVAGEFEGTVKFGTLEPLPAEAHMDGFLLQLEPSNGEPTWVKSFGSSISESVRGLAVDSKGNVWIAGNAGTSLVSSCNEIQTSQTSLFLAKFDKNGTCLKGISLPSSNDAVLAVDSSDDGLLVAGLGWFDIPDGDGGMACPPAEAGAPPNVAYVAKLDASGGKCLWRKPLLAEPTADGGTQCTGVVSRVAFAQNPVTRVLVAGDFTGKCDFPDGVHASIQRDGFVVALSNSDGVSQWSPPFFAQASNYDSISAMSVDSIGDVAVVGDTNDGFSAGGTCTVAKNSPFLLHLGTGKSCHWQGQIQSVRLSSVVSSQDRSVVTAGYYFGGVNTCMSIEKFTPLGSVTWRSGCCPDYQASGESLGYPLLATDGTDHVYVLARNKIAISSLPGGHKVPESSAFVMKLAP